MQSYLTNAAAQGVLPDAKYFNASGRAYPGMLLYHFCPICVQHFFKMYILFLMLIQMFLLWVVRLIPIVYPTAQANSVVYRVPLRLVLSSLVCLLNWMICASVITRGLWDSWILSFTRTVIASTMSPLVLTIAILEPLVSLPLKDGILPLDLVPPIMHAYPPVRCIKFYPKTFFRAIVLLCPYFSAMKWKLMNIHYDSFG